MGRKVRYFESAEEVFQVYAPDYLRGREPLTSTRTGVMGKEAGAELANVLLEAFHSKVGLSRRTRSIIRSRRVL
jgi:hypothetical protein